LPRERRKGTSDLHEPPPVVTKKIPPRRGNRPQNQVEEGRVVPDAPPKQQVREKASRPT